MTDHPSRIGRREAIERIGAMVAGIAAIPLVPKSLSALPKPRPGRRQKPNIVLIVADDMGYHDLGCYGAKDIATPNIDKLASQGVRFTEFHCAAPVCAPMRVSMMTGKYPQRTSLAGNPDVNNPNAGLSPDEVTIAEILKTAGYTTGLIGKWHLGYQEKFRPRKQGFDYFFGFLSGWADYRDHTYRKTQKWMFRNDKPADEPGYTTDIFTKEAIAFIDRSKSKPFFLYLAYNAPHAPYAVPDSYLRKSHRGVYGAVVEQLDDNIGLLMKHIKASGIEDNTLVIFLSDNGAEIVELKGDGSNYPLKGGKRMVYEGGIRTPFMARWPGHIKPRTTVDEPIISMDLFTTFARTGGAKIPAGAGTDGADILPVLQGKAKGPHKYMFWSFGQQYAARRGNWKIVEDKGKLAGLFDIASDPGEQKDLSAQHADIVKELTAKLDYWKVNVCHRGVVSG